MDDLAFLRGAVGVAACLLAIGFSATLYRLVLAFARRLERGGNRHLEERVERLEGDLGNLRRPSDIAAAT
jgi:hypothetical protein